MNTARSGGDIKNATIMSASVGLMCFVLFGLLQNYVRVYRTRLLHPRVTCKPPPLPSHSWTCLWGWIFHILSLDEQTLYDTAGLDALYFDRSNRLCLVIATFIAVINLGVVLPVNYYMGTVLGSAEAIQVGGMSTFDKISMTNIPMSSPLLWVHTFAVIVTVLFVCFCLFINFCDYRADRQAWLGHSVQEDVTDHDECKKHGSILNESRSIVTPIPHDNDSTHAHSVNGSHGGDTGVTSIASLLRRQFSQHVRDAETSSTAEMEFDSLPAAHNGDEPSFLGKNSYIDPLEISEVHSPLSVFDRQHVSVPFSGGEESSSMTWAVKAQQYAVLVTNVDPTSKAIRNPGGCMNPMQAAEVEVSRVFESLFPGDFVAAVPVRNHTKVDALLRKLDETQLSLLRLDERIQTMGTGDDSERTKHLLTKRDTLALRIRRLVRGVQQAKIDSNLDPRSGLAYFVIFKSQVAAAVAAQTLLQEPGGELPWSVDAAPAPDDINFNSLWIHPWEKWVRSIVTRLLVTAIIIFPIGVFTSSMVSLSTALCAKNSSWTWEWYCDRNSDNTGQDFFFRLLTAWIPSLLLAIWNSVVIPFGFSFFALFEGSEVTLSGLDRKIFRWFYLYNCLNVLLGGMLAGTLFSQLEQIIKSPSSVFVLLGHAVPQSSGFFLAFLSTNAFLLEPLRLLLPHGGVLVYLLNGCGEKTRCHGRIERDRAESWAPKSMRLGANYGSQQLMLLICLVFSTASPLISAFGIVYFFFGFIIWRYHVSYIFVRAFESGAIIFPALFSRILFSLAIYQVFMACFLLIKAAYVQAFILWVTVPPILFQFHSYCTKRFTTKSVYLPLVIARDMPVCEIPTETFSSPQMHPTFKGWGANVGKVWQGYGPFVQKFV